MKNKRVTNPAGLHAATTKKLVLRELEKRTKANGAKVFGQAIGGSSRASVSRIMHF